MSLFFLKTHTVNSVIIVHSSLFNFLKFPLPTSPHCPLIYFVKKVNYHLHTGFHRTRHQSSKVPPPTLIRFWKMATNPTDPSTLFHSKPQSKNVFLKVLSRWLNLSDMHVLLLIFDEFLLLLLLISKFSLKYQVRWNSSFWRDFNLYLGNFHSFYFYWFKLLEFWN